MFGKNSVHVWRKLYRLTNLLSPCSTFWYCHNEIALWQVFKKPKPCLIGGIYNQPTDGNASPLRSLWMQEPRSVFSRAEEIRFAPNFLPPSLPLRNSAAVITVATVTLPEYTRTCERCIEIKEKKGQPEQQKGQVLHSEVIEFTNSNFDACFVLVQEINQQHKENWNVRLWAQRFWPRSERGKPGAGERKRVSTSTELISALIPMQENPQTMLHTASFLWCSSWQQDARPCPAARWQVSVSADPGVVFSGLLSIAMDVWGE